MRLKLVENFDKRKNFRIQFLLHLQRSNFIIVYKPKLNLLTERSNWSKKVFKLLYIYIYLMLSYQTLCKYILHYLFSLSFFSFRETFVPFRVYRRFDRSTKYFIYSFFNKCMQSVQGKVSIWRSDLSRLKVMANNKKKASQSVRFFFEKEKNETVKHESILYTCWYSIVNIYYKNVVPQN